MATTWKHMDAATPRELDIDEAAATEDVLAAAQEWQDGTLPTGEALKIGGGMNPHRARGLALRHRTDDPRLPALRRLSELMSTGNGKTILPDGTMIPTHIKNQSDYLISQAKGNGAL